MRISDCSSDVCSSDLVGRPPIGGDVLTEGVRVEQAHLAIHFAGELLKEVVGPSLVGLRLGELADWKNHKAIGHYDVLFFIKYVSSSAACSSFNADVTRRSRKLPFQKFAGVSAVLAPMRVLNEPGMGTLEPVAPPATPSIVRSDEHTSELQSLLRTSYAVFCLKNKKNNSI